MADGRRAEPRFDGDRAGQKAAFRAADIALPHLKAGKSLRFAMLPQGQDPDDLARSGGPAAVGEVIGAARPLAEVLWLRETEGGGFDTPERRAALAGRLRALAGGIGDPDVRRFYQQDFTERLDRLFAPPAEARVAYGGRGARELARRFRRDGRRISVRQRWPERAVRQPRVTRLGTTGRRSPALSGGEPAARGQSDPAWPVQRDVQPARR